MKTEFPRRLFIKQEKEEAIHNKIRLANSNKNPKL